MPSKNTFFKSFWAVFIGFVIVFVLSIITDVILEALGILPPTDHPELLVWWMLVLALAYRIAYTVLGGYITARLAPGNPVKHAVILGCIGTLGGAIGTIAAWNLGNHWYPILLTLTALPSTWFGGRLLQRKR